MRYSCSPVSSLVSLSSCSSLHFPSFVSVFSRSRPVVRVRSKLTFTSGKQINLDEKKCTLRDGKTRVACFPLALCMSYDGFGADDVIGMLNVTTPLDYKQKPTLYTPPTFPYILYSKKFNGNEDLWSLNLILNSYIRQVRSWEAPENNRREKLITTLPLRLPFLQHLNRFLTRVKVTVLLSTPVGKEVGRVSPIKSNQLAPTCITKRNGNEILEWLKDFNLLLYVYFPFSIGHASWILNSVLEIPCWIRVEADSDFSTQFSKKNSRFLDSSNSFLFKFQTFVKYIILTWADDS